MNLIKLVLSAFLALALVAFLPLLAGCSGTAKLAADVPALEADATIACQVGEAVVAVAAPADSSLAIQVCSSDLPIVDRALTAWASRYAGADAGAPTGATRTYAVASSSGHVRATVRGSAALASHVASALAAGAQDAGH